MPRSPYGAILCATFVFACHGPRENPSPAELDTVSSSPPPARNEVSAEAIRSMQEGDLERARDLLDDLLLSEHMARAREALAKGSPEDALTAIDQALAMAPEDVEVRLLKGDASLRLAETKIRNGGGSAGLIQGVLGDARAYYQGLPESAHSLFGASRAAWLLGDREAALDLARRGDTLRHAAGPSLEGLTLSPERIYAEEVFDAYARARGVESPEARALFLECEDALAKVLGRSSDDDWAWTRLSDLYEWEGRLGEAQDTCRRGLPRVPDDTQLLERLARVSRALGGAAGSVKVLEEVLAEQGDSSAARWHLTVARFLLALEGTKRDPPILLREPFEDAEAAFRSLRARFPEWTRGAMGYEVVCRLARGWCALRAGDLEGARRSFLAMNELFERGVEWSLPGELESGIQGLYLVADAHNTRDEPLVAGEVFEALHALQPDSYLWANNAGFFLRDAAFAMELEGKDLCRAARGRLTNPEALDELRRLARIEAPPDSSEERAAFARSANERFERARAIMERSWQAYLPAAQLAPEDVRVVNDAALVLVYYLHHDLEWAEQALLRCVELGEPQIEAKRAALATEASPERAAALESELELLTEAWGDAHQNLGVLAWVHRKNGEAARTWLERSVEIWPARQPVTNSLLPQIRGELLPEEDDHWDLLNWAQPCKTRQSK